MRIGVCLAIALLAIGSTAQAANELEPPSYLALAPGATVASMELRRYDEYEFETTKGHNEVERGRRWNFYIKMEQLPESTPAKELWPRLRAALTSAGWKITNETPTWGTAHYKKGAVEAWTEFSVRSIHETHVNVVELGSTPRAFTLTPPGPVPEHVVDKVDLPFLAPPPGSSFLGGQHGDHPMLVKLPGADKEELVSAGSIAREYEQPSDLSTLEFVTLYTGALAKAGWTVVDRSQGMHQADASVTAHYDRQGRNLWAYVHLGGGRCAMQVSDEGELDAALKRDCHVALYGVLFDFNKATLKPESDAVLARVAALMSKAPALALEVQGHTDAVGDDAYNQTLSEARAKSVRDWLVAHNVAASRLSSKGYGKTRPVADNRTDEGRAKNRRVEIADPACGR